MMYLAFEVFVIYLAVIGLKQLFGKNKNDGEK